MSAELIPGLTLLAGAWMSVACVTVSLYLLAEKMMSVACETASLMLRAGVWMPVACVTVRFFSLSVEATNVYLLLLTLTKIGFFGLSVNPASMPGSIWRAGARSCRLCVTIASVTSISCTAKRCPMQDLGPESWRVRKIHQLPERIWSSQKEYKVQSNQSASRENLKLKLEISTYRAINQLSMRDSKSKTTTEIAYEETHTRACVRIHIRIA